MSAKNIIKILLITVILTIFANVKPTMQKSIRNAIIEKNDLNISHSKHSETIEEMNNCIDACSECLSKDLNYDEVTLTELNIKLLNLLIIKYFKGK